MEKESKQPVSSYQRLKAKNEELKKQNAHYADTLNSTLSKSFMRNEQFRQETKKMSVEYQTLKEAFELIGGHEAVEQKLAETKQEKQAQSSATNDRKNNLEQRYKQELHNVDLKEKAKLLKQEYQLSQQGHTFDRTESLEVRKNNINAAIDIEKMNNAVDRSQKWENKLNVVKSVSKAVAKTADELAFNPLKEKAAEQGKVFNDKVITPTKDKVVESGKAFNDNVISPTIENTKALNEKMVTSAKDKVIETKNSFNQKVAIPASMTTGIMKENVSHDISKGKEKVMGFVKKAKTLKQQVTKSIKTTVIKHAMLDKKQATVDDKLGVLAARASLNVSSKLAKGLQNKFSNVLSNVSSAVKDSLSKTKETFNKHLENEKTNTKTVSKEKDNGREL